MTSRQLSNRYILPMKNFDKGLENKDAFIGEMMRAPAPPPAHQLIVQNLLLQLHGLVNERYFVLQAPCDLQLSELNFRQPDLMLIKRSRVDIIQSHAVTAPPDIIIEVLSPTSKALDCNVKLRQYAAFGIPEYWIVDLEKQQIMHYLLTPACTVYNEPNIYHANSSLYSSQLGGTLFKVASLFSF